MTKHLQRVGRLSWLLCGLLVACDDAPGGADLQPRPDLGAEDGSCAPVPDEDLTGCPTAADDYQPRSSGSADDTWPACITDDDQVHLIGAGTPGSVARVMAFEAIGATLWNNPSPPSMQDFLDARNQYSLSQGLGSRVDRRQDVHYPEVPGMPSATACSQAGVPQLYPDRCAGPALLVPMINDAFQKGNDQLAPRVQAARIEAALVWFLYLSTLSEVWTAGFDKLEDIDSSIAYFTAATPRGQPFGLARMFSQVSPEAYQRGYDGQLAARCWRDLDTQLPTARPDLRDRASSQIDRASLRGLAMLARHRFGELACQAGDARDAQLGFLKVLVDFLDRESRARNAQKADVLAAQISATSADLVDTALAQAALDALYPCP